MFEDQTFDVIMERMLEQVDSSLDKREGSIIYDALAPAAAEIRTLYLSLDALLDEFNVNTATAGYLKQYGEDFSLEPQEATCAVIIGEFTPSEIDVESKTFSVEGINYIASDKIEEENETDSVKYSLTALTAGNAGNITTGTLIPVEEIAGLQSAKVVGLSVAGEDEEDTESFRARLIEHIKAPAFCGNAAYYKQIVSDIYGVGTVKVFPCTAAETETTANSDGKTTSVFSSYSQKAGCVTIAILNSEGELPTTDLIDTIKAKLLGDGKGYGLAPIGHKVFVAGPRIANIGLDIYAFFSGNDSTGANFSDTAQSTITSAVETAVNEYFSSFVTKWEKDSAAYSILSVQRLISSILEVDDIEEIWALDATIDDGESIRLSDYDGTCYRSIELKDYDFPKLSSLTIHFGAYPS